MSEMKLNFLLRYCRTATDKKIIWQSSNQSVATVIEGIVSVVGAGQANITATVGGKTATCELIASNPIT